MSDLTLEDPLGPNLEPSYQTQPAPDARAVALFQVVLSAVEPETRASNLYAVEAAGALFDHLFRERGFRRFYAYVEDHNTPSQRLCEKLGMRREGVFIEFVSFTKDEADNSITKTLCNMPS